MKKLTSIFALTVVSLLPTETFAFHTQCVKDY